MSGHNDINLIVEWLMVNYEIHKLKKEREARTAQICPKCGNKMVNLGFSGERLGWKIAIFHACDDCKVIKKTLEDDDTPKPFGGRNLKEYKFL